MPERSKLAAQTVGCSDTIRRQRHRTGDGDHSRSHSRTQVELLSALISFGSLLANGMLRAGGTTSRKTCSTREAASHEPRIQHFRAAGSHPRDRREYGDLRHPRCAPKPLPFPNAGSIVSGHQVLAPESFPGLSRFAVSAANYLDWRKEGDAAISGWPKGSLWSTRSSETVATTEWWLMPRTFELKSWFAANKDAWMLLAWTPEQAGDRGNHNLSVIARFKEGVALTRARSQMDISLCDDLVGDVRPALRTLLGCHASEWGSGVPKAGSAYICPGG